MDYVPVESLTPLANGVPAHAFDPISGTAFTEWHVHDEALFHAVIPDRYIPRTDIFVQIDEASVSASLNHAWEITAMLLRPSSSIAPTEAPRQTTRVEYTSAGSAGQLTRRTMGATGGAHPGCVDAEPLQPGDLLCLVLRRVPASSSEDPAALRVFTMRVGIQMSQTRISDCPGRLGVIIDSVRDLFNETSQGFLPDEFILRSVNRCLRELAQEGYWRRETVIAARGSVNEIDLLTAIPDVLEIHQVCFQRGDLIMQRAASFRDFMNMRCAGPNYGNPQFYTVQGNTLHVWPPPPRDVDPGFIVFHSYLPPELHCAEGASDPPLPRAYDGMLVHFALKEAFQRDRHAVEANAQVQQYAELYERDKQRLLAESAGTGLSLRPARR